MRAVILAGGKGTRLRPYTAHLPKPLVPVGERAILEILIERLCQHDIRELTLCVNHFARLIEAYFGDGKERGVNITYSMEPEPLGTMGPLTLLNDLPDNFLVMNGDLLTDLSFTKFADFHVQNQAALTVATYNRQVQSDFGIIEVDPSSSTATGFKEKPKTDVTVSMGVYALHRRALEYIPKGKPFGFDDLMLAMLSNHDPIKIYPFDGYWLDIGRPDDYARANEDIDTLGL